MGAQTEKIWFVYITDHHEGPFSLDEVGERLAAGQVGLDSLAWREGMPDWAPIAAISELAAISGANTETNDPQASVSLQLSETALEAPLADVEHSAEAAAEEPSLAARLAASQGLTEANAADGAADLGANLDLGDMDAADNLSLDTQESPSRLIARKKAEDEAQQSAATALRAGGGGATSASVSLQTLTRPGKLDAKASGVAASPKITQTNKTRVISPAAEVASPAPVSQAMASDNESPAPDADDPVWIVRIGDQVIGVHSYNQIREMVASGELSGAYQLWRPGWTNFQDDPEAAPADVSEPVPARMTGSFGTKLLQKTSAIKARNTGTMTVARPKGQTGSAATQTKTGTKRPKLNPMPEMEAGVEEAEDFAENLLDDSPPKAEAKFFGISLGALRSLQLPASLSKLLGKSKASAEADEDSETVHESPSKMLARGAGLKSRSFNLSGKNLVIPLGVVLVLGGGFGVYSLGLLDSIISPIPALEDVLPEEIEQLKAAARASSDEGIKFAVAKSREDLFNPLLYVATNAEQGSKIVLLLKGIPGKLVNTVSFELKIVQSLESGRMLTVGPIGGDTGKPLPVGPYKLHVSLEGQEDKATVTELFVGQGPGPAYERRMEGYLKKLQEQYDAEIAEVRQLVGTLLSTDRMVDERFTGAKSSGRPDQGLMLWRNFQEESLNSLIQLSNKAQALAKKEGNKEIFYPVHLEKSARMAALLQQVIDARGKLLAGQAAPDLTAVNVELAEIRFGLDEFLKRPVEKPLELLASHIEKGVESSFAKGTLSGASATTGSAANPSTPAPVAAPQAAPAAAAPLAAPSVAAPVAAPAPPVLPAAPTPPAIGTPQLPAPTPSQESPAPAAGAGQATVVPQIPPPPPSEGNVLSPEEIKALESLR